MKVLMISTDRKIFEEGSDVSLRMIEYGSLFEELHIIVFSMKKLGLKKKVLSKKVTAYPTNATLKPLYLSKAFRIGKGILKKNNPTGFIISTQDPFETGLVGVRLKKKFKIKLQVQLHGDFGNPHFKKESAFNRLRLGMAEKVLKEANCTRVVSKRAKKGIEDKYNLENEPVLLPIVTDIGAIEEYRSNFDIHKKYPQFKFIILMSSRLENVKNIELALSAFSKIVKSDKNIGLVILGDGTKKERLVVLRDTLNLSDNCIFEGWNDDVYSYLKTADLFLNTSNHEGFCLSLVEAAAAKCPIVTTKVGLVGDIINENDALICDVLDENCIVEKIKFAIHNHKELESLAERNLSSVRNSSLTMDEYLVRYRDSFDKCG